MADKEGKEERPIGVGDIVVIQSPTDEQRMGLWKRGCEQDKNIGHTGEVVLWGPVTGRLKVVTDLTEVQENTAWWYHPGALKLASKFKRKRYYKKTNGAKIQKGSAS